MAIVLALGAAVSWGTGDFLGGKATRNHALLTVMASSQMAGLLALLIGAVLISGSPEGSDLLLGSGGGLIGVAGLMLLYWALAHGKMSIVAPVTAVTAPLLPFIWGLGSGETLSGSGAVGAVMGLVAIVLISRSNDDAERRLSVNRSILIALASGVLIGAFLVVLDNFSDDSGLWPLVAARSTSVPVLILVALWARKPVLVPTDRVGVASVGVFDAAANALALLAFREGMLTLGAVLTSLYPAATVVLARLVDREQLGRTQLLGMAFGAVAITFIATG